MNDLEIIINSCDNYSDVWEPFFIMLENHWKDLSIPIMLNTESLEYHYGSLNIKTINNEVNYKYWGDRLLKHLDQIESDYVLMLFDDYILEQEVSYERIEEILNIHKSDKNIAAIYLVKVSGVNLLEDYKYSGFSKIDQRSDYILNSAPGMWKKDILKKFVGAYDTPWAWEFFGSSRVYRTQYSFYSITNSLNDIYKYKSYCGGAIHRGKWVKEVIKPVIDKYSLDLDCSVRGFDNNIDAKRGFKFYYQFFKVGWKMVNWDIFIFIKRAFNRRLFRLLRIKY